MTGRLQVQGDLDARARGALSSVVADPLLARRLRARLAPAITPSTPAATSIATTTSGTTSIGCGWTTRWSTPAPTSRTPRHRSRMRSVTSSIWSAASCGCGRASACSKPEAAGARWRSTWHGSYGVTVTAYNVSHEQVIYARERAAREGSPSRVTFIEDDYRYGDGAFRRVRLGRHAGACRAAQFRELGEVLRRTVRRDGGRGLLHFIGRDTPRPLNAWIRRRIFPGAYPPTLTEVTTRSWRRAGCPCSTWRICASTTRARWRTGAAVCEPSRTRCAPRYGERVSARLGAVPRRLRGVVRHGVAAAVPGRLRAGGVDAALLDARRALRPRTPGARP